jgi:hypothetical protein
MNKTCGIKGVKASGEVDLIPKTLKPVEGVPGIEEIRQRVNEEVGDVTKQQLWEEENKIYLESFSNMTSSLSSEWSSTLDEMFTGTMSFKEGVDNLWRGLGNSIIQEIDRMIAKWMSFQILQGFLSLIPGYGSIASIATAAIPGKAGGGSVSAGTPYKVGERGTELFVPERNGYIIPNDEMQFYNYNNISRSDIELVVKEIRALNLNLMDKKFDPKIINKIDSKSLAREINPALNKLVKVGYNKNDF